MLARAALAVALLAPAALAAQAPGSNMINLSVPDSIGEFRMIGRKDYDDPSLGVMVRFQRADRMYVDVFLYPGPDFATRCDTQCARNELKSEIDGFVAAFPEFIKRHYADSMTVAATRALTPASGDQWRLGHHLRARQVLKGEEQLSDLYLYYLPGFRVKLRATYPADSARAMTVSALAPRVVPAFAVNPARVADADTGRHVSVTVTLAGGEPPIFAQIVAAMVKQGYTIADSSVTAGRIVTAPYFGWPKGSEKEGWHGADSPGVVLMASLEPRGDSTFVALSGRSPVAPGWKDTKVAEQVELMSVIMLAGELPDSKKKKNGTAP